MFEMDEIFFICSEEILLDFFFSLLLLGGEAHSLLFVCVFLFLLCSSQQNFCKML